MNDPNNTKASNTPDSPQPEAMPYSSYFDNPYLNDVFNPGPDYTLNSFFDSDTFFDQPTTSVESASNMSSKAQARVPSKLPGSGMPSAINQQQFSHTFNQPQYPQYPQYRSGFSIRPTPPQASEPGSFSPLTTATTTTATSQSSSHCGDAPHQAVSPSLSPHMLKRESPSSPTSASESSTPKRPTRKRGRPRMDRKTTDSQSTMTSPTSKGQSSRRQPHNQVERKYREGLNSELERLRKAVPILRQSDGAGAIGQPKPSKATILSSAIEYIQTIEKERDALKQELEQLRRNQTGSGSGGGGGENLMRGPTDRSNQSLDEYLMDS